MCYAPNNHQFNIQESNMHLTFNSTYNQKWFQFLASQNTRNTVLSQHYNGTVPVLNNAKIYSSIYEEVFKNLNPSILCLPLCHHPIMLERYVASPTAKDMNMLPRVCCSNKDLSTVPYPLFALYGKFD